MLYMPRFAKGSAEAKEWAKKMADARDKKAGRKSVGADEKVVITKMGEPELVLPEYFATRTKKGWKLVNPMTQERNLSTRDGETSVKLSRKPVADGVLIDGKQETIHLSLFSPQDRELIRRSFERVETDTRSVKDKPRIAMGEVKERGRPEKLPKNIEINKERRAEAKRAMAKPKGRPSKYGDDEEARKQAKKEQDRIANQKRTEKRRQAKLQGTGVSDDESDEELSNIMANISIDSGKKKKTAPKTAVATTAVAQPQVIQRPVAYKPQANKGTKRKAESLEGSGFKGYKRLDQDNIILTMDEGDEFKKLIKKETTDDLRMLHQELKEQLREAQLGTQSHTTIRHHNDLRKKISEIEEEVKTRTMSGTGKSPKQLKKDMETAKKMSLKLGRIVEDPIPTPRVVPTPRVPPNTPRPKSPPKPAPPVPALDEPFYIAIQSTAQLKDTLKKAIKEEDDEYADELKQAIDDRMKREKMAFSKTGEKRPVGFLQDKKRVYGEGMDEPPIDWEDIKWGSFSKQFKEYNRTAKKPLKDLEKFANMIMKTPEKFKPRTLKRARFYLNVLLKKQKNNISTDNIEMPKKSKMTADAGMGLYAGMAEPSGRGMYAGDGMYAGVPPSGMGMYAGEGFFGDLAKSALKSAGSMAVDAGANYAKNRLMGTGMCCGDSCAMCGGAIYNPTGDPKIAEMNEHIGRVMRHQLQMGMSGQGIFGDIGRWFKKAGRTISKSVLKPVAGFAIREGLPALANLAGDVVGQPELGALATPLVSKGADALARSVGVGMGGAGMKKPNAWIDLVKRVQREKGVSYKEAMSIASQMRK